MKAVFKCIGNEVEMVPDSLLEKFTFSYEDLNRDLSGKTTYNILKRVEDKLKDSIVHLCGKTSSSLESIGLLEAEKLEVEGQDYFERILNLKDKMKDIKYLGHWCLKTQANNDGLTICKLK